MKIKCISIVSPNGARIARGEKTLEIRSWMPNLESEEDLLVVENHTFLREEEAVDPDGKPVALVKIGKVREYVKGTFRRHARPAGILAIILGSFLT
ncbi:MAG: ASCH domain-containing protein [Oligoflexia bacterium]|nr:ASCH domain-containing protein [Oligoflexia bacterium]